MHNNIANVRKSKNISQVDLAEMVGIRNDTLNHVEKGRYRPSTSLLERLAVSLNVSIKDLFLE